MNLRGNLLQLSNICMVLASTFIFWKTLALVSNSPSPIVVVLSGSMEPAFQRGDVLFLWNRQKYQDVGDIVVYNLNNRDIPIVHRVLREHKVIPTEKEILKHEARKKTKKSKKFRNQVLKPQQKLFTKGDNNPSDDLSLYGPSKMYLDRERDIIGSVKAYIPKVGYVTIYLTENVYVKYLLILLICLPSLFSNEL